MIANNELFTNLKKEKIEKIFLNYKKISSLNITLRIFIRIRNFHLYISILTKI